jgi:hypothetical protein
MKTAFHLTLSILIITAFAGLASASRLDDGVNLADFAAHPEIFSGRVITVEAQVIAINADGKGLELFDSESRVRMSVRLTQLPKAERTVLMRTDVRRALVSGRASVNAGRLTIDATSVQPVKAESQPIASKSAAGARDQ